MSLVPRHFLQPYRSEPFEQWHAYKCRECEKWFGPFRAHRQRTSPCHPAAGYAHRELIVVRTCPTCQHRLCCRAAAPRSPIEHLANGDHRPDPLFVVSG